MVYGCAHANMVTTFASGPLGGASCWSDLTYQTNLNMMGLIHSLLDPSGTRMPKVRV